jgi:hypothetical protein
MSSSGFIRLSSAIRPMWAPFCPTFSANNSGHNGSQFRTAHGQIRARIACLDCIERRIRSCECAVKYEARNCMYGKLCGGIPSRNFGGLAKRGRSRFPRRHHVGAHDVRWSYRVTLPRDAETTNWLGWPPRLPHSIQCQRPAHRECEVIRHELYRASVK